VLAYNLNFADDEGNLERSARQIKAQAFPYDAIDCAPLIVELLQAGLLMEYEVEGRKYIHIKNFAKHQKIDQKSKARSPLAEDSTTTQRALATRNVSRRPEHNSAHEPEVRRGAVMPSR
jgi:hypothetical protein